MNLDGFAVQRGLPGVPFPQPLGRPLDIPGAKAPPGPEGQGVLLGVEQQDGSGVHAQLVDHLLEQDLERDLQVQRAVDGGVDLVQGRQALQAEPGFFE